jgi:predicted nucleic acid-binding protein
MGKPKTHRETWDAYDLLSNGSRITFCSEGEADTIEKELRGLTSFAEFAPQQWPDAYLAAFARAEGLVLVTFDRALSRLAGEATVLLK